MERFRSLAPHAEQAPVQYHSYSWNSEYRHHLLQNETDFPQTKLDSEINAPFLLNHLGDPRHFFKCLLKTYLKKKKKKGVIAEHDFFSGK